MYYSACVQLQRFQGVLRAWLDDRQWSNSDLERDSGISNSVISRWFGDPPRRPSGWVQVTGKGAKQRALSIWDPDDRSGGQTVALLRAWLKERATLEPALGTDALWLNNRWGAVSATTLRDLLHRVCRDADVPGNRPPHTFRRSHFSEAYREHPETVRLLAARMGWSPKSHQMIDTYTRGANIELTRLAPVPLVSKQLRRGGGARGRPQTNGPSLTAEMPTPAVRPRAAERRSS